MSLNSKIEWCDATWNVVRGCTKVSPGCANCYAETFAKRWRGVKGHAYEQGFDLRLVPDKLDEPLRRKKPTTYFVNSMSDLFQDGVPDEFIDRVFAVMALAPQHTFQILTKRAERMREYVTAASERWGDRRAGIELAMYELGGDDDARTIIGWPLLNVWLGVSVENQHFADERIPLLLQTPAAVRFLSCEPLLEGLDLAKHRPGANRLWVIVCGESGAGARPCDVRWVRSIVRQCQQADVPVFVKQLGTNTLGRNDDGFEGDGDERSWPMNTLYRELDHGYQGAPVRIMLHKKGGDMAEWPEDLRVRQMPSPAIPSPTEGPKGNS